MSRKEKKDWDLDTLLSIVGFVFELIRVIVNALRKRNGTINHLRRLLKEPQLVDEVFNLIVKKATSVVLGAGEYLVRVGRDMPRDKTTLEAQFSENGVSDLFFGDYKWKKHSSRLGKNDITANEVVMIAKQFSDEEIKEMGGLTSENIIAWGMKNDLVAADEEETYAFGVNPETCDLQRKFWLVGLGSSAMFGANQCVAVLSSVSGRRFLDYDWFGCEWLPGSRFLFVRK